MAPIRSKRRSGKRDTPVHIATDRSKLRYRYKSLGYPDEIRLLVLAPGPFSSPLECKLLHTRLSQNPKYEALSYAWGDLFKPRQVFCGNRIIDVTESLYSALRNLRDLQKTRVIWADAICINQLSNLEKNHQIAQMGMIYSQSERTLAWIGEAEDDVVGRAFDYLNRLDVHLRNYPKFYDNAISAMAGTPIPSSLLSDLQRNWIPELGTNLGPLLANPWFKRLWVLQEMVLSNVVEVVFGARMLPLEKLLNPILLVTGFVVLDFLNSNFDRDALSSIFNLGVIQRIHRNMEPWPIPCNMLDIFQRTRFLIVSDPKDKIYALLGLGYAPGFVADYNLSINDTFQAFTLWCLENEHGFDVLSLAGLSKSKSAFRSWIPGSDLTCSSRLFCQVAAFHASTLNGSGSHTAERLWHLRDGNILELRAGFVDDVDTIAEFWHTANLGRFLSCLKGIVQAAKCTQSSTADKRYNRLFRAIFAELYTSYQIAHPVDIESARMCLRMASRESLTKEELKALEELSQAFWQISSRFFAYSNFCLTRYDRFAWIPQSSKVGDKICVIKGASVPFVLRPLEDGTYSLVGECWVQGIMEGEALGLPQFTWTNVLIY